MPGKDSLRVLFIADIVGKPGREIVKRLLPGLVKKHGIGLTIANGENAAGGLGVTPRVAEELHDNGVQVITSGNHIWKKKEVLPYLNETTFLLRPFNYPPGTPGKGSGVYTENGNTAGVLNLEGRVYMNTIDCPFRGAEGALRPLRERTPVIIVDFHAEATSEKRALGWFLDGKVSAVIGTHTHIPTADEEVLPQGTAYITDAGMTGAFDSVIGIAKDEVIKKFTTQLPAKFVPGSLDVRLCGVLLEIDPASGKALSIERLMLKG